MPLIYTHSLGANTRLAVWQIEEDEGFFLRHVPPAPAIKHPHKRLQHLAGRYLLCELFPDFPLPLIRIDETRKPYLESESHRFSISHCGAYAAAIVSTSHRVGIDVETPQRKVIRLNAKFLNEHETQLMHNAQGEEQMLSTLLWSAKESLYKWYSLGGIDFKKHLCINAVNKWKADAGDMQAVFAKEQHVSLAVFYRLLHEVVLTYIVH